MTKWVAAAAWAAVLFACGGDRECAGEADVDCDGALGIHEAPICEDCDVRCDPPESSRTAACWQGEADVSLIGIGTRCTTSQDLEDHRDTWIRCDERDGARVPVCYRMNGPARPDDLETPECVDTRVGP